MISKLAICGVGRLGLPLALNFGQVSRLEVNGYDCNQAYVEQLQARTFQSDEPGVSELLGQSTVLFHTSLAQVLQSEMAVVCVRTDSVESGAYDLSQLEAFQDDLIRALTQADRHVLRALVINCNVNPGTCQRMSLAFSTFGIEVYFWPEWVKQGSIIEDQRHPAVTVLGTRDSYRFVDAVLPVLVSLDQTQKAPVKSMSLTEAELCKISLNCFLTVKISFANMVATLLEELGLKPDRVLETLGHDPRIGGAFLKPGFGYGGPCLPRDNGAMTAFASNFGVVMPLCEAADQVNAQRHEHLCRQAVRKFHSEGCEPAVESLSYKTGVPIFTESQQLRFVRQISSLGISTQVADNFSVKRVSALPEGKGLLVAGPSKSTAGPNRGNDA